MMRTDNGDTPGVVARPPVLYLTALALGLALDYLWPASLVPGGLPALPRYAGGATLVALGAALMAGSMGRFRRRGTNVETWKPTTALVTDGPYRFSRNPIYIALTLVYVGIGVLADAPWVLALLVPLLGVMRYGVIGREERYLERKFGEDYRRYRAAVRRWI